MAKVNSRKDCPNISVNKGECACKSISCERHGFCCECIEYHRNNGGKPGCLK